LRSVANIKASLSIEINTSEIYQAHCGVAGGANIKASLSIEINTSEIYQAHCGVAGAGDRRRHGDAAPPVARRRGCLATPIMLH
jgi:hypothetical protein